VWRQVMVGVSVFERYAYHHDQRHQ
jgi:hypothetical protein